MTYDNELQKRLKAVEALKKNTKRQKENPREEPLEVIFLVYGTVLCGSSWCDGEARLIGAFKSEKKALIQAIDYKSNYHKIFVQEIAIGEGISVRRKLLSGDRLIDY